MNVKTAKMIRSGMFRVHNVDPATRIYSRPPVGLSAPAVKLNHAMSWRVVTCYPSTWTMRGAFLWTTGPMPALRLAPTCGRAVYRKAKRVLKYLDKSDAQRRNNHG